MVFWVWHSLWFCPFPFPATVKGSPAVECGRDFVQFGVATKKPFGGRVYVKGEFENAKCVKIGRATGGGDGENGRNNGLGTSTEFGGRRGGKKGDEEEGKLEDVGRVPEGEQAEEEVDEETIRQILQVRQRDSNSEFIAFLRNCKSVATTIWTVRNGQFPRICPVLDPRNN